MLSKHQISSVKLNSC